MEKIVKDVEIMQVIKIKYKIIDEKSPMPEREVIEFQTLEGEKIGCMDPLEKYKDFFKSYKCKE